MDTTTKTVTAIASAAILVTGTWFVKPDTDIRNLPPTTLHDQVDADTMIIYTNPGTKMKTVSLSKVQETIAEIEKLEVSKENATPFIKQNIADAKAYYQDIIDNSTLKEEAVVK